MFGVRENMIVDAVLEERKRTITWLNFGGYPAAALAIENCEHIPKEPAAGEMVALQERKYRERVAAGEETKGTTNEG